MRLFVFGLGYSARVVVERMRPRLEAVWGTTRDAGKFNEIAALGVSPLLLNAGSLQQAEEAPSHPSPSPSPQGGGGQVALDPAHQSRHEGRLPSPLWGGAGGRGSPMPYAKSELRSLAHVPIVVTQIKDAVRSRLRTPPLAPPHTGEGNQPMPAAEAPCSSA